MKGEKLTISIMSILIAGTVFILLFSVFIMIVDESKLEKIKGPVKENTTINPINSVKLRTPVETLKNIEIYEIEQIGENDLIGKIKNNTGETIKYLEIKAIFYNSKNEQIFDDVDIATNLKKNEVWTFMIYVQGEYDSVRMKTSTYTPDKLE
ncbi:MAG: FxLYD domain-containing protein [Clostridiales bacterium]